MGSASPIGRKDVVWLKAGMSPCPTKTSEQSALLEVGATQKPAARVPQKEPTGRFVSPRLSRRGNRSRGSCCHSTPERPWEGGHLAFFFADLAGC